MSGDLGFILPPTWPLLTILQPFLKLTFFRKCSLRILIRFSLTKLIKFLFLIRAIGMVPFLETWGNKQLGDSLLRQVAERPKSGGRCSAAVWDVPC